MEEDINILDEVVGRSKELREKDFGMLIGVKEMQAIENLIKRYRKLEKRNNRQFKLLQERDKNSIPKTKIQEKIDELEKLKKELEKDNNKFWHPGINNIIYHIQELMEDK